MDLFFCGWAGGGHATPGSIWTQSAAAERAAPRSRGCCWSHVMLFNAFMLFRQPSGAMHRVLRSRTPCHQGSQITDGQSSTQAQYPVPRRQLTLHRSVSMLMQLPPPLGALQSAVARDTAPLQRVLVMPEVQPLITVSTRPAWALACGASSRHRHKATAMMAVFISAAGFAAKGKGCVCCATLCYADWNALVVLCVAAVACVV